MILEGLPGDGGVQVVSTPILDRLVELHPAIRLGTYDNNPNSARQQWQGRKEAVKSQM